MRQVGGWVAVESSCRTERSHPPCRPLPPPPTHALPLVRCARCCVRQRSASAAHTTARACLASDMRRRVSSEKGARVLPVCASRIRRRVSSLTGVPRLRPLLPAEILARTSGLRAVGVRGAAACWWGAARAVAARAQRQLAGAPPPPPPSPAGLPAPVHLERSRLGCLLWCCGLWCVAPTSGRLAGGRGADPDSAPHMAGCCWSGQAQAPGWEYDGRVGVSCVALVRALAIHSDQK